MKPTSHVIAFLTRLTITGFFLGVPALLAQGWTDLPNTRLSSVCPPNNFQPVGGGMPAYSFADLCGGKVTDFSSAVVDTRRNRFYIDGGGHGGYQGNEKYALDLVNVSTSIATCGTGGGSCTISTNSSAPTMTRLNDPSVPVGGIFANASANCAMKDGSRPPEHTWGAFVYLPKHDVYVEWLGANTCLSPQDNNIWVTNPATMAVTNAGPPSGINPPYNNGTVSCVLNPLTAHETFVCLIEQGVLVSIDADNSYAGTQLAPYNSIGGTGSAGKVCGGCSLVVDPDRKLLFVIGNYSNLTTASPQMWSFDMTQPAGSWNAVNWAGSTTGCSDLMSYGMPSLAWDPSLHKIVGYVPRLAASNVANNQVTIFDPATKTCVAQPIPGGPAADFALRDTGGAEQGMYGRFAYFPSLGKYVIVNSASNDAYTFTLNLTPVSGLGGSTLTCVDRDGDGYGTGPGCIGPDADDQDVTVRTGAEFLAKWSTIPAGLQHLGYKPANIWYISTTGNDGTGAVNDVTHPFATCCGSGKANPAPGDAVLLRGGTYSFFAYSVPTGTAGNPILYMSYPGELAYFGSPSTGFNFLSTSNVVLDGMKFYGTNTACVSIGIVSNMAIRHVEASGCEWGIDTEQPTDFTIEDSVLHDAFTGGGQHGIYLTNHSVTTPAQNVFVRRNLLYNNPYTGFQFNGRVNNLVVEQNIAYNNDTAGFSWETGVSNSIFRSNVSINNEQGLVLYQYQAFCDVYDPTGCPYGENNNLIENFTSYSTGIDRYGVPLPAGFAAITVGDDSTRKADMGHNIYRNINVVNNHVNGYGLAPLNASDAALAYFSTSTFDHLNLYNSATPAGTTAFSVGSNYYTCAQAAAAPAVFGSVSNCNFGDPQFTAASTTYATTITSFDLSLQSTSPAVHAGTSVNAPVYDVLGHLFANSPSLGAYEVAAASGPPSPCDINHDGQVDYSDEQSAIAQVIGINACGTADLLQTGICSIVDVERVIIAEMGGACIVGK